MSYIRITEGRPLPGMQELNGRKENMFCFLMLTKHHILFDENIHLNEDEAFKMKAMYAADRIRTLEKPLYI